MGYDEIIAKLRAFDLIKMDLKNALEEKGLNMDGVSFKKYYEQINKLPYFVENDSYRVLLTDYYTKISDDQGKKLKLSFYNRKISKSVFEEYGKDAVILKAKPFFKQHIDRFLFNNIVNLDSTKEIEEKVYCSIKIKLYKDNCYYSVIESDLIPLLVDEDLIYNKIYNFTFKDKPIRVKFNYESIENINRQKVYLEFLDELDFNDTYYITENKQDVLIDLEFFVNEYGKFSMMNL